MLINPEFKVLLFELLKEEGYDKMVFDENKASNDAELETRIDWFVERKLQHCKLQGI